MWDEYGNWIDVGGYGDTYDNVVDVGATAADAGTMGDAPWMGNGVVSIPDYGPVGAGVPNVTQTGAMGGAVMAGVGAVGRMLPAAVVGAIVKLSQRLGGATGSVAGYGRKVWGSLSSWASRNPGVSLLATLTSLGLTAEEAAHFIAWGATTKRKKRTRGISGRDIKTVRRTMRKFRSLQHALSMSCGVVRHRRKH